MAIPVYSGPTVAPTITQAPRVSPGMAQNNLGALAEGVRGAVSDIAKAQMEADNLRIQDAFTPFKTDVNAIILEAEQVKAKNVLDPQAFGGKENQKYLDRYNERFEETKAKHAAKLTPRQQEAFNKVAEREKGLLLERLQRHEAGQIEMANLDNFKARDILLQQTLSTLAVKDGQIDGAFLKTNLADRLDNITRWAKYQGLDPEPLKAQAKAGTHTSVILALQAANNPKGAEAYFGLVKDELDQRTRLDLDAQIKEDIRANDATLKVVDAWTNLGPKKPGEQVDEQALMDYGAKAFANDREAKAIYNQELALKISSYERDYRRVLNEGEAAFWNAVEGGTLSTFLKSPEWKPYTAKDYGTFRRELFQRLEAYRQEKQGNPNLAGDQLIRYYEMRQNPDVLSRLSPAEIGKLRPQLGPYTDDLLKYWEAIRQPGKLPNARVDAEDLRVSALDAGLNPFSTSKDDKERMVRFQESVETQVYSAQEKLKRPLTREEKRKIVKDTAALVPFVKKGIFGESVKEKPRFEMQAAEDFRVPGKDEGKVRQYLEGQGIQVTPQRLWNTWRIMRQKGMLNNPSATLNPSTEYIKPTGR